HRRRDPHLQPRSRSLRCLVARRLRAAAARRARLRVARSAARANRRRLPPRPRAVRSAFAIESPTVSAHDFLFALALAHEARADALLDELMSTVFGHVGLAGTASHELGAAVRAAVGDAGRPGRPACRVEFEAAEGKLRVTVVRNGIADWQDARPLP